MSYWRKIQERIAWPHSAHSQSKPRLTHRGACGDRSLRKVTNSDKTVSEPMQSFSCIKRMLSSPLTP